MDAYIQYLTRKAALNIAASNPAIVVHIPEEPDFDEVIRCKASAMLVDCTKKTDAESLVFDYELLYNCQAEILMACAEAFCAMQGRQWDHEGRKDRLSALGDDVLRIVSDQVETVAKWKLEHGE